MRPLHSLVCYKVKTSENLSLKLRNSAVIQETEANMITLHHLNKSRSKRIIWLLEELGIDYNVIAYQRDSQTFLAPATLKAIHPLGKSPVIEDDGWVVAESGAITEYLINKYAADTLAPKPGTEEYVAYSQWLHFAESSAILPLLLKMFVDKDGCTTNFMAGYADDEIAKLRKWSATLTRHSQEKRIWLQSS